MQKRHLDHLLHQNVLLRISDPELYGNEYDLAEFVTELTDGIFKADLNANVNSFRQNLQVEYVERLIKIMDDKSPYHNARTIYGIVRAEPDQKNGNRFKVSQRFYPGPPSKPDFHDRKSSRYLIGDSFSLHSE